MGTHPIFESDFDCLTECLQTNRYFDLILKVLMELAAEILPYGISCCAVYLGCKVEQARQDEKKRLSKAENKISSLEKKVRANKKLIDKLSQNGDDMKFKIDLTVCFQFFIIILNFHF